MVAFVRIHIPICEISFRPSVCNKEIKLWEFSFLSLRELVLNRDTLVEQHYFLEHKHFLFNKYLWGVGKGGRGYILLIRKSSDSANDIKLLGLLLLFQYYEYVVCECVWLCVCVTLCVCVYLKERKSVWDRWQWGCYSNYLSLMIGG